MYVTKDPKTIYVCTWYMTKNVARLTFIQTSYKFLFYSIVNTKWEISWIYFQFIETRVISSNRQFGGQWNWNIFGDIQSFCLFTKISDFQAHCGIGISCLVFLLSNICDFYRLSLREASQKSLTLWKHSQNITAHTFLIGAEGTYPLFMTLVCHSWTPFIVDLGKPHFIWGALTDPLPLVDINNSQYDLITYFLKVHCKFKIWNP